MSGRHNAASSNQLARGQTVTVPVSVQNHYCTCCPCPCHKRLQPCGFVTQHTKKTKRRNLPDDCAASTKERGAGTGTWSEADAAEAEVPAPFARPANH